MRDGAYLLIVAILFAAVGWAFWHYAGDSGFNVVLMVALIAAVVDNIRLRRSLRSSQSR